MHNVTPTSAVADFYAGRSILVTGVTGFVGKVLVEKLLRSVPRLKSVYVLVRSQRGQNARQRLQTVVESDLFDLLRPQSNKLIQIQDDESPTEEDDYDVDPLSKLVPIDGDITESNLGLSPEHYKIICERVSVVFHCAATVKFDEHMRQAVQMNVDGTRRLLELCHKMKRLDAFVHTSTAYCNCDRTHIVERVYPAPVPWQKLIDAVDWMDDPMLERLTPVWIGRRPNTYTFTKAVAESMLVDDPQLPIVIVRPSIVTAIWKEPKPGWIDNYNGATGVVALGAKGLLRTLYGRLHEVRADLVPADVVANMLIVAGWHRGVGAGRPMPVVHCTSGRLNPISWGDVIDRTIKNFTEKMPLADLYRIPGGRSTTCRFEYETRIILQHLVPAYLVDRYFALIGRRPIMVRLYGKISKALGALEYFYTNQWDFQSKMAVLLNAQLSDHDRQIFYIDVQKIDWIAYMEDYHWGVRKYIFKEEPSNLSLARRIHFRRRVLTRSMELGFFLFISQFILRKTNAGRGFLKMLTKMLFLFLGMIRSRPAVFIK